MPRQPWPPPLPRALPAPPRPPPRTSPAMPPSAFRGRGRGRPRLTPLEPLSSSLARPLTCAWQCSVHSRCLAAGAKCGRGWMRPCAWQTSQPVPRWPWPCGTSPRHRSCWPRREVRPSRGTGGVGIATSAAKAKAEWQVSVCLGSGQRAGSTAAMPRRALHTTARTHLGQFLQCVCCRLSLSAASHRWWGRLLQPRWAARRTSLAAAQRTLPLAHTDWKPALLTHRCPAAASSGEGRVAPRSGEASPVVSFHEAAAAAALDSSLAVAQLRRSLARWG